VLTVSGELRKTRLFRSHEQVELVGAIADTLAVHELGEPSQRLTVALTLTLANR
jgi:hypothetical protein